MGWPEKLLIFFAAVFLLVFPASSAGHTYNKSYSYDEFNDSNRYHFNFEGNATSSQDALQITRENVNIALTNQSGRITYKTPFKLWEKSSTNKNTLASFTSNFDINVSPVNGNTPAEGLAFIIAPDVYKPDNSYGQWLGLMNSSTNGSTTNHLVAIEFDTYKQSFDPNGNHVGININSINSNKTTDLSKSGIEIAPVNPTNYTVWIDYNGPSRLLEVYMIKQGENKPSDPVINITLDLSEFVNQESYLGFSASTGENDQLNCVLRWNLTIEILPDEDWVKLVVTIVVPVSASLIIVGALIGFYIYRHRVQDDPNILGALKNLPGTPREIRFSDLKKATNNFSEKSKLGQGGFGVVYKGILPKENKTVAVKKFSREAMKGKDDFLAELTIINRLRHKHLVRLEGWCYRKGMLLLVYEYMPNGSLDTHLFGSSEVTLSWERRYKIITGVASALHYLHNEYDQKVVHRDLKASNVLLDSDFNARLGDFGLARVIDNEKTSYAEFDGIHGTMGYIAPECFLTGKATRESDVFGFGAVVLEVICGRRPRSNESGVLVDWVWSLYREERVVEAVDGGLNGDFEEEDAKRLLLLGLACSHSNPNERPKTQAIVQIISRSEDPPFVPAFRPPFVWNMGSGNECSSSLDVTGATSQQATSSYYGSGRSPISRGDNTGDFVV